jgi:hypothetical protein
MKRALATLAWTVCGLSGRLTIWTVSLSPFVA